MDEKKQNALIGLVLILVIIGCCVGFDYFITRGHPEALYGPSAIASHLEKMDQIIKLLKEIKGAAPK